jgi:hypothetical protein
MPARKNSELITAEDFRKKYSLPEEPDDRDIWRFWQKRYEVKARALVQMIFRRVETIHKALDLNPDLDAELRPLTAQRHWKPNLPKGVSHE